LANFEWLLAEREADFAVPSHPLFVADDENWRANVERVVLGPSLEIFLNDIRVHRDYRVESTGHRPGQYLIGHVTIEGGVDLDLGDGVQASATRESAVLYRRPCRPSLHAFKAGTRLHSAGYTIDLALIERLFDGDVPPALRSLFHDDADGSRPVDARSDDALRNVARQLFAPGLNGALRRLMMEGAMLQLFALQAAAAGQSLPSRRPRVLLSPRERAAIHEARERLLADMRNPPALGDLADAVALSEKRLNAGFRLLFGATAFETLRNERLDHARRALEKEATSLKEIAFRVGYNHISNFVHAFRDRFGAPPRRYLANIATRHDEDTPAA
jgi:AraC-like DNA-binding protein